MTTARTGGMDNAGFLCANSKAHLLAEVQMGLLMRRNRAASIGGIVKNWRRNQALISWRIKAV